MNLTISRPAFCRFVIRTMPSETLPHWFYDGSELVSKHERYIEAIKAARVIAKNGDGIEHVRADGAIVGLDVFRITQTNC